MEQIVNKPKLYRFLNELGRTTEMRFACINLGGCCVYASIVGSELEQRGIQVRGIVGQGGNSIPQVDINYARTRLEGNRVRHWQKTGVLFHHVALEFCVDGSWKTYDTRGVKPAGDMGDWNPYPGRLTLKEVKQLADDADDWNSSFDRRSIPVLTGMVQASFRRQRMLTPVENLVNRIKSAFK